MIMSPADGSGEVLYEDPKIRVLAVAHAQSFTEDCLFLLFASCRYRHADYAGCHAQ